METTSKPRYNLWQNTAFMLREAWHTRKSVIFLCVALAAATAGQSVAELLIAPVILQKVEQAAALPELLGAILCLGGALALLAELGDASWAQAEYLSLSEGQRQLVLIARTLVRQPPLLLLDEPDSALDYPRRYGLLRWLKAYARREEAGVLLCSHDANIALRYADRLLLLGDGRLLDDVGMADTDAERLREALGKIYGPVDVLRHGGTFLMTRGDAE